MTRRVPDDSHRARGPGRRLRGGRGDDPEPRTVRLAVRSGAAAACGAGPGGLDFDSAALAALRAPSAEVSHRGLPDRPGRSATLASSASRSPRPTPASRSPARTASRRFRFPRSRTSRGRSRASPTRRSTSARRQDALVAYVHSTRGHHSYVGPDESGDDLRRRARPTLRLNAAVSSARRGPAAPRRCPPPLTAMAEPIVPGACSRRSPASSRPRCASRRTTSSTPSSPARPPTTDRPWPYVATLFGAINVVYERDLALHLAVAEVHVWTGAGRSLRRRRHAHAARRGRRLVAREQPMATYPRRSCTTSRGKSVVGRHRVAGVLCSGDFGSGGGHYGGGYGVTQVYGTYPLRSGTSSPPRTRSATTPARRTRTATPRRSTTATAPSRLLRGPGRRIPAPATARS